MSVRAIIGSDEVQASDRNGRGSTASSRWIDLNQEKEELQQSFAVRGRQYLHLSSH